MHALGAAKEPSVPGPAHTQGAVANLKELEATSSTLPRAAGFIPTAPRVQRSSTRAVEADVGVARGGGGVASAPGGDCVGPAHLVNAWRRGSTAGVSAGAAVEKSGLAVGKNGAAVEKNGAAVGASMAGAFLDQLQATLPPSQYELVRKAIGAYAKVRHEEHNVSYTRKSLLYELQYDLQ